MFNILELWLRDLFEDQSLNGEERSYLIAHNEKYRKVLQIVEQQTSVSGFRFTPNDNFMETPAEKIADAIVRTISSSEVFPLDFGDYSLIKADPSQKPLPFWYNML